MKKTIKNKILIPLIALFTLSVALFGIFNFAPKSVDASFVSADTEVRVDAGENAKKGMRFTAKIPVGYVEEKYPDYTISYGTFIMPESYIARKGEINEANTFGVDDSEPVYVWGDTQEPQDGSKWWIIHAPITGELDKDANSENYLIKASVNMNNALNLNTKYTSKAYIKAVKGEEVKYEFVEESATSKSLLDVAVNAYDAMPDLQTVFDGFINSYVAVAPESANVSYSIVHKYSGSEEVEAYTGTARIGADLSSVVSENDEPIETTALSLQRDYRYYYNNGADLGSLRAKPDGTTKIVIDFAAKKTYQNKANPTPLALNKFNSDMTDNEPYADSYSVEVKNGEEVRTATVLRSEIESLSKGYETLLKYFPENEPIVYETYVKVYTGFITSQADLKYIGNLGYHEAQRIGGGEYFLLTTDIDMTGYTKGFTMGTVEPGSSYYYDRGFRGRLDGNGHVLYNLSTRLFDILGFNSEVRNLTVIGTALTSPDYSSLALIARAAYGDIINCNFDITVPSTVNTSASLRYWPSIVFDNIKKQSTYIPKVVNTVFRINNASPDSSIFGDATEAEFYNSYIFTNAEELYEESKVPTKDINLNTLNADFTSDAEVREIFVDAGWTLDSKLPALNGRVISHGETSYSAYKLNDSKDGRIPNGAKEVAIDGTTYVIPEDKLQSQATGKATHFVKSGDDFGIITVDKVTALISSQDDVKYFLYLAGGGTDASIVDTNFDKYGVNEIFVLTNNITLEDGVVPVLGKSTGTSGSYGKYGFQGTLDGNGFTISNLTSSLMANLGSAGVIKNLSVVADNVVSPILYHMYGLVDNCYFDFTASTAGSILSNYAYGSQWNNSVIKINNLSTQANASNLSITGVVASNTVNGWRMNNTIVMANSSWYNAAGNEGVAPTVISLDGLDSNIVSNFMTKGGNKNVWTENLTFKEFAINETSDLWAKWEFANGDYTTRVANTDAFVKGNVSVESSVLTAINDGGFYLSSSHTKDSYDRTLVRVVTGIANNAEEIRFFTKLCGYEGGRTRIYGYIVLNADVTMTGNFGLGSNPSSGSYYEDSAFGGVIDGMGHYIKNSTNMMFNSLGTHNGAVIKNLKFLESPSSFAGGLGNVTFENCEFDFRILSNSKQNAVLMYGVLGDNIGASKKVTVKDTVIKVQNVTGEKLYIVETIGSGAQLIYDNVEFYAQEKWVGTSLTENSSIVTQQPHTLNYYDASFEETLYYGRYAFAQDENGVKDRTTRVINKFDLEGVLSTGDYVKITNAPTKLGIANDATNANVNPNAALLANLSKVMSSSGNYYDIKVLGAWAQIFDAQDVVYMTTLLGQGWDVAKSTIQTFGFNNNIDMAGITSINYQFTLSGESHDWGWKGAIYGNNKTIYNLNVPLVGYTNAACTIENLTFKNLGPTGCLTQKSSGGKFNNLTFDFDASNMSDVKVLLSQTNNNRGSSTEAIFNNLVVNVTGAKSTFVLSVSRGPHMAYTPGAVRVNSATVTMNDGKFSIGRLDSPTVWTDTTLTSGPVTNKVVSGVFNIDNTFTNTTVA